MIRESSAKALPLTRRSRGLAALCFALSLWFSSGCDPTSQRIPPTPPPADTADTASSEQVASSPSAAAVTPDAPENAQGPRFQQDPHTFTLIPWPPAALAADEVERFRKTIGPLYQQYRTSEMSQEEYDKKVHQISIAAFGLLPYTRMLAESGHYDAPTYADRALAENPDDFETLITWAYIGGQELYYYGEERAAVLRRLYEMQPHHPYVLHHLALCIYGTQPAAALGYAQKAQQLEPRYLPYGVDGLCYYQMGDYEQAVAAFERAHAAAPARMKLATLERVEQAKKTLHLGEAGEDVRQRLRDAGEPLMGPILLIHH